MKIASNYWFIRLFFRWHIFRHQWCSFQSLNFMILIKFWNFDITQLMQLKFLIFHHVLHQCKIQLCFFNSKFVLLIENDFFELYFFRLNRFAHQLIALNFVMKRSYDWSFQSNHNQNQRWFLILIAIFWSVELIVFRIDFNSKIDFFRL